MIKTIGNVLPSISYFGGGTSLGILQFLEEMEVHEGYCRKYDQSLHPQRLFLYKINWL